MKKLLLSLTFVAAMYMAQGQHMIGNTGKKDAVIKFKPRSFIDASPTTTANTFKINPAPSAIFVFGSGQESKINIQYKEGTYHLLDTTYTAENNTAYMAIRSICEIEKVKYQMVIKFSYTGSFWRFHSVVVEPYVNFLTATHGVIEFRNAPYVTYPNYIR